METIEINGARENNLKNISLSIPRNKVVCFVGVSGSGKSTIAFDIVAREGQRQYFESLPSMARRYLQKSNRPDADSISGLSSTIIISQDRVRGNRRSTVGTLTEAYTHLRLLYSRVGLPSVDSSCYSFNHPNGACSRCKGLGKIIEIDPQKLINFDRSLNEGALLHSEWQVGGRMWSIIKATHYFDMDEKIKNFGKENLDKLLYAPKQLWQDDSEYGANKWTYSGIITRLSARDRHDADELGYVKESDCRGCHGGRLNDKALAVRINGKNIGEVANFSLKECLAFVKSVGLPQAVVIRPQLEEQLEHLIDLGVGYLFLNRSADTLSGGEAQRVKMARQLGCDLIETIYVLDEPTAGLHPKDVDFVVENLRKLRDQGNSVLVVEHDPAVIKAADYIVEVGPGGGNKGGEIIAQGNLKDVLANPQSVTAAYLRRSSTGLSLRKREPAGEIKIVGAKRHNLKNLTVSLPTGVLIALTGVSGSGKSSLIEELAAQHGDKIVLVDQDEIGNNKRGCIGTYTGAFDIIRKAFAQKNRVSESLFSFNSRHGACEECRGLGYLDMEMNFLGNVKIHCETCNGTRYKEKILRYKYNNKNIAEVLKMTAQEIGDLFDDKNIRSKTDLLVEVGLDYLEIGQTLDTLSGGESQRLKLASRLQEKGEFIVLDEPTSGLHFKDIEKLMKLLNRLVDSGNTVLVVEHNLDVISQSDWVIDLGPEGGDAGGEIVAKGTPVDITKAKKSYTGKYLQLASS